MGFPQIVGVALAASLLVPIGMAFQTPSAARRTALIAWALLLPAFAASCGVFISQGEAGFLSNAQAIATASFLLALSFGLGYGASKVFHARSSGNA